MSPPGVGLRPILSEPSVVPQTIPTLELTCGFSTAVRSTCLGGETLGSVRKRPGNSDKWEARYRDAAGKSRSKSFRTKREAEAFLARTVADLQRGAWVDPRHGQVTFGAWAEQWAATRHVSPTTAAVTESRLRVHVLPAIGSVPLGALTPMHVRSLIAGLTEKGLAPSSVRSIAQLVRMILGSAVEAELLARSPADGKLSLPREGADERVFLTPAEVDRLAEAVPDRYRALVLTAAYTGLRWGELAGLKVARLELLRRPARLHVVESLLEVAGKFSYGPPKSAAGRRAVTLPQSLVDVLALHLATFGQPGRELVFTGAYGAPLSRNNFRNRVWLPAVKAAALDPTPRFHDLRHTHVAFLIAQGMPVKAIQQRVGHASAAMTLNRYGHLLPEVDDTLRDGLDELLRGSRQGGGVQSVAASSSPFGGMDVG